MIVDTEAAGSLGVTTGGAGCRVWGAGCGVRVRGVGCNAQATIASGTTCRTLVTFSVLTGDERAILMT